MATYKPVDHDPFAAAPAGGGSPIDHDPFAVSMPADIAKSGGVGLAKGAISSVGAAGDLRDLFSAGIDYAAEKMGIDKVALQQFKDYAHQGMRFAAPTASAIFDRAPTSKQIQGKVEEYTGEFYKPQTIAGEYAQTIGEFAPAALGGPGGITRKGAQVVIPALVSETAGQVTKGSQIEPYARFTGALVGGTGAGLASRPGTASQAIRAQLPEGVTPQMVDQAEALIQRAGQQGIRLAWPEALSQVAGRPVLTNTMRHLEASPQTEARMAEFFGPRAQQVEDAARRQFDDIAPINPNPSTIGRDVGRAAETEVNMTREVINDASQPFYDRASTILLTPEEMGRVRRIPGFQEARDAIRGDPQLNRYVANLPDDSVGFLNEVKKYFDTAGQNAAAPVNQQRNMQRAAGYENDANVTRRMASLVDQIRGGGDYQRALDIQQRGREQVLQPLLDGYIGKLAKQDQSTQDAINALFPQKPLPNSQDEIGRAVTALNRHHPRAASDLVRAHVEQTFNQSARDLQSGANQAGGAKFRAALVGEPQQAANLEAAVRALPNGAQRWEGFSRFLDILEATGTRQNIGSRTAYNAEINKEKAMGGLVRDASKVGANPTKLLQPLVDRYDQYKLGRNLDQLAGILTDPAAANQLRAIARMPEGSSAALSMALKLVTYGQASQ